MDDKFEEFNYLMDYFSGKYLDECKAFRSVRKLKGMDIAVGSFAAFHILKLIGSDPDGEFCDCQSCERVRLILRKGLDRVRPQKSALVN